jgi:hypothetical protein
MKSQNIIVVAFLLSSILLFHLTSAKCLGKASFTMSLQGKWNKDSENFPGTPGGAHFSPAGIAIHAPSVSFWNDGEKATPGLALLAERGSTSLFLEEIRAVSAQIPGSVIDSSIAVLFSGLDTQGSFETTINVDPNHPDVTWVTMLGPTPDWFAGLSGYSLCDDQDNWKTSEEFDISTWDSGTRSNNIWEIGGPTEDGVIHSRATQSPTIGPVMSVKFDLINRRSPVRNLRTGTSQTGVPVVRWDMEDTTKRYLVEFREEGSNDAWEKINVPKPRAFLPNLVSGRRYTVRVAARFPDGSAGPRSTITI